MREIKFRAWDEQKKIMHKNFQFIRSGIDGNDWIIFDSDTEKQRWDGNFNPYFAQQFKIMQYTGLKDKNGKEIYEGDILKCCFDGYDEPCEVFYDYAICCARTIKTKNVRPLNIKANQNSCGWCSADNGSPSYDFRVIGNIYENPELLKVGTK